METRREPGLPHKEENEYREHQQAYTRYYQWQGGFGLALIVHSGPSLLTGDPVMAVMTGHDSVSRNQQTGRMITIWFLPAGESPTAALKSGGDRAVCGDCEHRPGGDDRRCYVRVYRAPQSLYRHLQGASESPPKEVRKAVEKSRLPVRFGGWGDPASVPREVIDRILEACPGHTAYTSSWRLRPDLADVCMASVSSVADAHEAQGMGFKTYRMVAPGDPGPLLELGERWCPTVLNESVTCDRCRACDGSHRSYCAPAHGAGLSKHGEFLKRYQDWRRPR